MTAIQGFIPASRRPGELGIHSLDRFLFSVPDLAVAQRFYSEFGLDIQTSGSVLTMAPTIIPTYGGRSAKDPERSSDIAPSAPSRTTSTVSPPACRI